MMTEDLSRYAAELRAIDHELEQQKRQQCTWIGFVDATMKTIQVLHGHRRGFRAPETYKALRILEGQAYRSMWDGKHKLNHEILHPAMATWYNGVWVTFDEFVIANSLEGIHDAGSMYIKELRRNLNGR